MNILLNLFLTYAYFINQRFKNQTILDFLARRMKDSSQFLYKYSKEIFISFPGNIIGRQVRKNKNKSTEIM